MAKQPWINLNNWSLWMSADEYSGGSFLYSQWINVTKSSKSFKISDNIVDADITKRASSYHIALVWPYSNNSVIGLSSDWYLESDTTRNEEYISSALWGSLYKRKASWWYVNWIKLWNYTLWIAAAKIDVFTGDLFDPNTWILNSNWNYITNPWLTSNDSWTVWAWRTTGVNWATHTSGTELLSQSIAVDWSDRIRFAVRVSWHTAGTCQLRVSKDGSNTIVGTITTSSPLWNVYQIYNTEWTWDWFNLNPSSDFNWTISYVQITNYRTNQIEEEKITITSATSHPICPVAWYLYIGSWSKIDVLDLLTRWVETFDIIDSTYTIVSINQVWQSIVIFASDWQNSKQYYRDRVSDAVTEVILWKDKNITNAVTEWTSIYVLAESNYKKELYVCSWYDRQLIAQGKRNYVAFWQNKETYRISQRNDFYNYPWRYKAMWFSGNKLLIPAYNGIYTYWFDNPWFANALVKERVLDTTTISAIWNFWWLTYIAYTTIWQTVNKARIWYIREYETERTWYLVTNPILWDNFSTKKQLNRFRLWYTLTRPESYIDIFISANKNYFRTVTVSWVTTTPEVWARYTLNSYWSIYEVISTNITWWAWTISMRLIYSIYDEEYYNWTLTKTSWTWDNSISFTESNNFVKLKRIQCTTHTQWEELIFWQEFLLQYMPDRHTMQLKIELYWYTATSSPEIFDIPVLAEPVWQNG